jgi:hypothetical protein
MLSEKVLQGLLFEGQVGDRGLQLPILFLERLQPLHVRDLQAAVL